jgi:hypothetical protein
MVCAVFGQQQTAKPLSVPTIEDSELYYSFFLYHQTLIDTQTAAKAASPSSASQLDQQMAALLQVDVKELPFVISNTRQATASYSALTAQKQAAAPVQQAGPNAVQLAAQQELQRVRITVEGVRLLASSLTPTSWSGLHGYIVGTYKNTIYKH